MIRRFIKDSAIYMIPSILNRGISIILVPLYTRVLSPADYGALDLMLIFLSAASILLALEIASAVGRFYMAERESEKKILYASTGLWFTLSVMVLAMLVYLTCADTISRFVIGRTGFTTIFRLSALYFTINGICTVAQNQLRNDLQSVRFTISSIINMCVTALCGIYLTYCMKLGLTGLLAGMTLGAFCSLVYSFLISAGKAFRMRFSFAVLREMMSYSLPLVPASMSVFVSGYIGRFIINHFLTLTDLGLYGIATKLAALTSLVMVGFPNALSPLIYTYYMEPDTPRQIGVIFRIFCAAAIAMFAALCLYAREILIFFTAPSYYSAYKIAFFLIPQVLIAQISIFLPGAGIAKKTKLILWINLGGALLNTALAWILVSRFGTAGAAAAALLGTAAITYVSFLVSQKFYRIDFDWKPAIPPLLLSVAFIALAYSLPLGLYTAMAFKALLLALVLASFVPSGLVRVSELKKIFF